MTNKSDLWEEFQEENPDSILPEKHKQADGSEWVGKYDRRKNPRVEDSSENTGDVKKPDDS